MAEYIEREARYIDIKKVTIPRGFFNQDLNVPKLFDWLESQAAADVAEVRHGEWYWYEEPHHSFYDDSFEYGWKCSCCDNYPDHDNYMADSYEDKPTLKFCPNCGAKMDGKAGKSNA